MNDDKYVVFKREDFETLLKDLARAWGADGMDLLVFPTLDDAVVIRTQDVFAASGLSAYAHNIQTWCEIESADLASRDLASSPRHMNRDRFDRLNRARRIADYFSEQAYEASARDDGNRFPD